MKNYYAILEIPESASAEMIKNAYRNLAKRWHPDLNPNDQLAEAMFMDIKEAYTVLSNAIKRNYYDYQLRKAILEKKVEPTSYTKVGSFRKKEQETTKKHTSQEKQEKQEKVFFNSASYKSRLDDLMRKHNELIEKEKKIAEASRKKQEKEKEKSFYDIFRENRDKAFELRKMKEQEEEMKKMQQKQEVKPNEEANITKPQRNRIKAILSILGFRMGDE